MKVSARILHTCSRNRCNTRQPAGSPALPPYRGVRRCGMPDGNSARGKAPESAVLRHHVDTAARILAETGQVADMEAEAAVALRPRELQPRRAQRPLAVVAVDVPARQ